MNRPLSTIALILTSFITADVARAQQLDQYLLPVVPMHTPGAFGSVWTSELTLYNAGPTDEIVVDGPFCNPILTSCRNLPRPIGRGAAITPEVFGADGVLLSVTHAEGFAASFRIRDISRETLTWGTELPVVNVNRFSPHVDLLNIPQDDHFRLTLRIYSTTGGTARVRVVALGTGALASEQTVRLTAPVSNSYYPAYAQLNIPSHDAATAARIEIDQLDAAAAPLWAFVSITNNETQHVTAVTPQP